MTLYSQNMVRMLSRELFLINYPKMQELGGTGGNNCGALCACSC